MTLALRFFTRENCSLCDSAWAVLMRVLTKLSGCPPSREATEDGPILRSSLPPKTRSGGWTVERVDIELNPSYSSAYRDVIPVITVLQSDFAGGLKDVEVARSFVEEKVLYAALKALQKS